MAVQYWDSLLSTNLTYSWFLILRPLQFCQITLIQVQMMKTTTRLKPQECLQTSTMDLEVDVFSNDSRYIAQKAEQYAKKNGFTKSYWAAELEFFVLTRLNQLPVNLLRIINQTHLQSFQRKLHGYLVMSKMLLI